ncbi:MAG: homocysteine S-methyltransferase [Silvibacterium sp.]|nr:homocysteine S-methyltransferase [Silvibacterium sp.]
MKSFSQLDLDQIRVLDGGMATELERRGCDISGPLWSAHVLDSNPDKIAEVHLDYLRAGSDCISTASYQVSAMGYSELGQSPADAANALRRSVVIAETAREKYTRESDRRVFIAASLGPYGAALHNGAEFHGRYTIGADELEAFHAERLATLAETNADLVALETVPSLEEGKAIAGALAEVREISAWVSFTCRDEAQVAHGERLADCAASLDSVPQVVAIGINCTAPRLIGPLIAQARKGTAKPIFLYPNSGELWDAASRRWYGSSDAGEFATMAAVWYEAGAHAVGGCCRTGPAHIRAVREVLESTAAQRG